MNVKQIVPAEGWQAVVLRERAPFYELVPLVAWALVQRAPGDEWPGSMVGLMAGRAVLPAENAPEFYGYVHDDVVNAVHKAEWEQAGMERVRARTREEAQSLGL